MKKPALDLLLAEGILTQAQYDIKLASIQADRANRVAIRGVIAATTDNPLGTNVARIAELEQNVRILAQQLLKFIRAD